MSESHFYKSDLRNIRTVPTAYMEHVVERACSPSATPHHGVHFELGFKTSQHFTTVFRKTYPAVLPANNGESGSIIPKS